jgi:hypothetical protein
MGSRVLGEHALGEIAADAAGAVTDQPITSVDDEGGSDE